MDIHFDAPQWVHLLWAVLAFVLVLAWLERRGGDALDRFVGTTLLPRLLAGPSGGQRVARIAFLGAAGAFLSVALMRPQWGVEVVESRRAGAEIMICLDVSRSMLAEDVAPNRLERAKAEIRDLLELLDGDQVGLIVFAGRASVLSPLTPDFGFLRLSLDDASPNSVARGGTRLEEPVRKAVDGFGDADDISRSILLITDGEDHDSFPLEAAENAAERGIRILAIGFGAETGSEIPITDPDTGARTLLRNADGAVVQSRLDGDLLREMALITSGAYIPAGTGVLDLDSIYRRHIAPLTRGRLETRARTVRNDAFQWAVLLGLLALLGAVMSTARARVPAVTIALGLTSISVDTTLPAIAQALQEQTAVVDEAAVEEGVPANGESGAGGEAGGAVPDDARTAYNEGLAKLETGDAEAAARLLEGAREQAGTDGEARFRATYNLGWAEVSAADALIESEPQGALDRLYRAAAWFREAVDLRPGHDDARYNLEIVMRRALELADSIASQDDVDLRAELDALIQTQRDFLTGLRAGVAAEQTATDANVTPELRRQFRSLAARELTVLADAEKLSERAARELEVIDAKADEERTPEEALRAARLEAALAHVHRARERIGQTRTRLRRMQGERAYRRAASALGALQRARDQLLDPVARLDALLADGMEVAQLTGVKAALERGVEGLTEPVTAPDWLTPKYLAEAQERVELRTAELHMGLEAGLDAYDPDAAAGDAAEDPARAAKEAKLVEKLRVATPLIEGAQRSFATATGALSAAELNEAVPAQRAALQALAEAREQFLDLRGLIELVYGEEATVANLIAEETHSEIADDGSARPSPSPNDLIGLGAATHLRNVERTVRLDEMIGDALVEALESDANAANSETPAPSADQQRQFFEHAHELLRLAQDSMHAASETFSDIAPVGTTTSPAAEPLEATRTSVDAAVEHLTELRRLFFNVLEHLRDTAHRQQTLADDTEALAALADPNDSSPRAEKTGPLGHRQERLATTAEAISEALRAQAEAPPPEGVPDASAAGPDPERLTQAADFVAEAQTTMNDAASTLTSEAPALDDARASQDEALVSLAAAIEVLQDDQGQSQEGEQQQQDGEQGEQESEPEDGAGETDLAQLLQGVRDREARRREERARDGAQHGYEPVEKDW